jgi:hypothetical protein
VPKAIKLTQNAGMSGVMPISCLITKWVQMQEEETEATPFDPARNRYAIVGIQPIKSLDALHLSGSRWQILRCRGGIEFGALVTTDYNAFQQD